MNDHGKYRDLDELIMSSRSSSRYFFTLPTDVQFELMINGELIHDSSELHLYARCAERRRLEQIFMRTSSAERIFAADTEILSMKS